jgi:hypothetical protein
MSIRFQRLLTVEKIEKSLHPSEVRLACGLIDGLLARRDVDVTPCMNIHAKGEKDTDAYTVNGWRQSYSSLEVSSMKEFKDV